MLIIQCSEHNLQERLYIYKVILGEWLGLEWAIEHSETPDLCITNTAANGKLIMSDIILNKPNFNISLEEIDGLITPVNKSEKVFANSLNGKKTVKFSKDIFGMSFLMLTRYEEYLNTERDNHDRFPAKASTTYQSGVLSRPIVDEWVELLWGCLHQLWPNLKRRDRSAKTLVSCDVDSPYESYVNSLPQLIKQCSSDLIVRKSLIEPFRKASNYLKSKFKNYSHDIHNTFSWIMDVNESAGNKVAFYFIVDNANAQYDAHYNINEARIRKLLREIHARGHEIGLHASYDSYSDRERVTRELQMLKSVLAEEGLQQQEVGVRQHYLRWSPINTAANSNAAGLAYDSTMAYADFSGFRCGTSHEYPMFDLKTRETLNLRQRPLIVMEGSVINPKYMGLGYSKQAIDLMLDYKQKCYQYGGNFTLLWHNSHFGNETDRHFYLELIK